MVPDTPSEKAVSHGHEACELRQNTSRHLPHNLQYLYCFYKGTALRSDVVKIYSQYCPTRVIDFLFNFICPTLLAKFEILTTVSLGITVFYKTKQCCLTSCLTSNH